jgi:hypothetical protein
MHHKKNLLVILLLLSAIVFGAAMPQQQPTPPQGGQPGGARPPEEPFTGYKNLKVLPKNISKEDLEKTMRGFRMALGVQCGFCHKAIAATATTQRRTDFVSDENPHKNVARKMIKMVKSINKKYFNEKDDKGVLVALTCKSCHNGKEKPDMTM